MKNIDFEFKPKTYFKKKNEKRVVVATISFSEGTKIYLNVKGNENEFEFYLTDTINELEYKYSFENMKSDEMLNLQKIIDIIQNDIADCEGKKNIIFEDIFNIWKKKQSRITVTNDPKVPGIFGIFPKPNIVTNNVFKILIILCN